MKRTIPLPAIGLVGLLLAVDGLVSWLANAPTWAWGGPWALGTAILAGGFAARLGANRNPAIAIGGVLGVLLLVAVGVFGLELGGIALNGIPSIVGFLIVAIGTIAAAIFTMLRGRAGSEGANVWVYAVAGLAIVILLNYLAVRHLTQSFDLTSEHLESLSQQTVSKLRGMQEDVHVIAFFREDDSARLGYARMLQKYADTSPRFSFDVVDPDKYPNLARDENLKSFPSVVIKAGNRREEANGPSERDLTSAIIKVTRPGTPVIYFTTWHEERPIVSELGTFVSRLRDLNYNIQTWRLAEGDVPDDAELLVIAGPRAPFAPAELDRLKDYLAQGRKLLVFVDPDTIGYGFEDLLARYGASIRPNFIVERERGLVPRAGGYYMGEQQTTYVRSDHYGQSDITLDLHASGIATGFYMAREVRWRQPAEVVEGGEIVFAGSRLSFTESDVKAVMTDPRQSFEPASDQGGPFPVGVFVSAPATDPLTPPDIKTRLVVFGDTDFITDRGVGQERGNLSLGINAVSWLTEDPDLIAIQPREPGYKPLLLTRAQGTFLFLVSVWRYPALILVIGLAIWWYRRSRGPMSPAA